MSALDGSTFIARWDTGLSEDEIYALLTDDGDAMEKLQINPLLTAAVNKHAHTGAMVALVPSEADLARLAVEGGEDAAELHLTLAFLGEAAAIDEDTRDRIMEAAGGYFTDAITTEAFSVNVFNPHNPDMATAVVLGIKGEDLVAPQSNVLSAVRGVYGAMPEQHAPWIPHVTLKYTDDVRQEDQDVFLSRLGTVTFDRLRFAFGGEVVDVPLDLPPEPDDDILFAAVSREPRQLRRYWLGPEGSARVGGWGNPGSFRRCQSAMREEGVPGHMIDGLCANLYRAATGHSPGRKKEETAVLTAAAEVPQYARWEGTLTLEGVESGDGRLFEYGSLDWDLPPLPLMYQPANIGGHNGSVMVGQIQEIHRRGNKLYGSGIIDLAANYNGYEIGKEVYRLMSEEFLTGVSVDVDKVKDANVRFVYAQDAAPMDKPIMTVFERGRVRGATLVAFPAFTEARLALTGEMLTASAVGEILIMDLDDILLATAGDSHTITIPNLPPAEWFSKPTDVTMKGALTVTDEGRVFGRLAPANTTHRSVNRQVPMGIDYSRFMGAETLVAGGGRVVTGPITMNCGHASADPKVYGTYDKRIEHYDNSCSVVANVVVGEDADGPWVAGALAPFATAEQVTAMMSCRLSGDWQPHPDKRGQSELIAALLVPVPGFAQARTEASVTFEDGALTASVVPVEYMETAALTAAVSRKAEFAAKLRRDLVASKIQMAKKLRTE